MVYRVIKFSNGKFGVKDARNGVTIAAGMTREQASQWADRMNLRSAWGK